MSSINTLDIPRFTKLLFADQLLDEILAASDKTGLPVQEDTWSQLSEAAECLRRNECERTRELLLEIVGNPTTSTRVLLWAWRALRHLGLNPRTDTASEIKGVVIEVPMGERSDVLAAYADGTARYVNHSGKIVIWDLADAKIQSLVGEVLDNAKVLAVEQPTAEQQHGAVRITVLTLSGNRFAETTMQSLAVHPINAVFKVAAELMISLIKRTEATSRLVEQSPTSPRT